MSGSITVFATSVVAIASLSGVALGNYAITTKQPILDTTDISKRVGNPDASYGPDHPLETADMAPTHMPVCRKGCGPTLSERQAVAYFDDGYTQLDRVYDADQQDYTAEAAYEEPSISAPEPTMVATSPRATTAASQADCLSQGAIDCSGQSARIN